MGVGRSTFPNPAGPSETLPAGFSLTAPQKSNRKPSSAAAAQMRHRPEDPIRSSRMAHNSAVRGDRAASEAARSVYLKRHLGKLRPFVTEQV